MNCLGALQVRKSCIKALAALVTLTLRWHLTAVSAHDKGGQTHLWGLGVWIKHGRFFCITDDGFQQHSHMAYPQEAAVLSLLLTVTSPGSCMSLLWLTVPCVHRVWGARIWRARREGEEHVAKQQVVILLETLDADHFPHLTELVFIFSLTWLLILYGIDVVKKNEGSWT